MLPLEIVKIALTGVVAACDVPAIMDRADIEWHKIECDTWKCAEINPAVTFRIAHTGSHILLQFHVSDNNLRAEVAEDNGRVWEDSCCEFFVSPDCDDNYYNFECNCIGTLLLHGGWKGTDRGNAPEEVYGTIGRWSSLGDEAFGYRMGPVEWDLVEVIPATALFNHEIKDFSGRKMKANFYKCGDKTAMPHFLSWAPIDLPSPAFHCPEFFSEIVFE